MNDPADDEKLDLPDCQVDEMWPCFSRDGVATVWNLSATGDFIRDNAAAIGIDPKELPPRDRRCFIRMDRWVTEKVTKMRTEAEKAK